MGDISEVLGERKLSGLKHDIRNPLYITKSLIETHLEFLENPQTKAERASERTKSILKKSLHEINRVLLIIQKLNGIHQNSKRLSPANGHKLQCSVTESLDRIIRALKEGRYLERVFLIRSVPSDLPPVCVDSAELEEIFFNLVMNAAQAMREGGSLFVDAYFSPGREPRVLILFRDTGCGIPEEALPYIFEPFYSGSNKEEGVGFGLYIVRQLAERNGGRIAVKSRPGRGTVFTVAFPAGDSPPGGQVP